MNLLKKYYSMSTLEKLDKVDLQILRTLQENARLTTKELALASAAYFGYPAEQLKVIGITGTNTGKKHISSRKEKT
mgnify:CR=1 FL=1